MYFRLYSQQEIKDVVTQVHRHLESAHGLSAPFPYTKLNQVVSELGGRIESTLEPMFGLGDNYTIPADASGMVIPQPELPFFRIILPTVEPEQRRNFTIAHELGHLFLHLFYGSKKWVGNQRPFIDSPKTRSGSGSQETEANIFAGNFLMPDKLFKEQFCAVFCQENNTQRALVEAAQYFHVSISAAKVRATSLKLI